MKEFKEYPGWYPDVFFRFDEEEFSGERKAGQCRCRTEKAAGRGSDGKLFLTVRTNHDKYDPHKYTQSFYEISRDEYIRFLDRAVLQKKVKFSERKALIEKADEPFSPLWNIRKDTVVYSDEKYTLGQKNENPYLTVGGKTLCLTCHPYEPCLYITDDNGFMTAVHNAFDPLCVLEAFASGKTVTSITGFEYDAKDFCRMVDYAQNMADVGIDGAERVFGNRPKKKNSQDNKVNGSTDSIVTCGVIPDGFEYDGLVLIDDPFYGLIGEYPGCAVDYRIIKDNAGYCGCESHRRALAFACRELFIDSDGAVIWNYDVMKAAAKEISIAAFFAPEAVNGSLNYRRAFLHPPHENGYTEADFERINAALFPSGTDRLSIYEWTTDWSDYFDAGHEWWGALCLTVYDKNLDRFAVILASETD